MPLLTQGKTNWKFLLIVVVLAAVVGGWIWFFLFGKYPIDKRYVCELDSDCVVTCCGCLNGKTGTCEKKCEYLPEIECKCAKNQCIEKEKIISSNWKIYTEDVQYNFQFKYPTVYSVTAENSLASGDFELYLKKDGQVTGSITIMQLKDKGWLISQLKEMALEEKTISIDKTEGMLFIEGIGQDSQKIRHIVVEKNESIYLFYQFPEDVLSTFKFLD